MANVNYNLVVASQLGALLGMNLRAGRQAAACKSYLVTWRRTHSHPTGRAC